MTPWHRRRLGHLNRRAPAGLTPRDRPAGDRRRLGQVANSAPRTRDAKRRARDNPPSRRAGPQDRLADLTVEDRPAGARALWDGSGQQLRSRPNRRGSRPGHRTRAPKRPGRVTHQRTTSRSNRRRSEAPVREPGARAPRQAARRPNRRRSAGAASKAAGSGRRTASDVAGPPKRRRSPARAPCSPSQSARRSAYSATRCGCRSWPSRQAPAPCGPG